MIPLQFVPNTTISSNFCTLFTFLFIVLRVLLFCFCWINISLSRALNSGLASAEIGRNIQGLLGLLKKEIFGLHYYGYKYNLAYSIFLGTYTLICLICEQSDIHQQRIYNFHSSNICICLVSEIGQILVV